MSSRQERLDYLLIYQVVEWRRCSGFPLRDAATPRRGGETHGAAVGIFEHAERSDDSRRGSAAGGRGSSRCWRATRLPAAVEGSAGRASGTNPIAWACPRRDGPPVVVVRSWGFFRAAIEVAAAAGAKLPRGVASTRTESRRAAAAALDGAPAAGGIEGRLGARGSPFWKRAGGDLAVDSDIIDGPSYSAGGGPGHDDAGIRRAGLGLEARGAAARESREASRRADSDHASGVPGPGFELQRRARGGGDVRFGGSFARD